MDLDQLQNLNLPPAEVCYGFRETILYALGLGYGTAPTEESELRFVYEANLKIVPSICTVLGHPESWLKNPQYKVDWIRVLHAEQSFVVHMPLPATGRARCEIRVVCVEDKGPDKGAMLHIEKTLFNSDGGARLATSLCSLFLRGDGGQGGFGAAAPAAPAIAARAPDRAVELTTSSNAALIYRLSGDFNPLHVDPAIARQAGFERPILHGLCTFGIACRAILNAYCGNEPARLRSMSARFSAPVYPGETIRFEFHESGAQIRFKAIAKERGTIVLDRGSAELAGG